MYFPWSPMKCCFLYMTLTDTGLNLRRALHVESYDTCSLLHFQNNWTKIKIIQTDKYALNASGLILDLKSKCSCMSWLFKLYCIEMGEACPETDLLKTFVSEMVDPF